MASVHTSISPAMHLCACIVQVCIVQDHLQGYTRELLNSQHNLSLTKYEWRCVRLHALTFGNAGTAEADAPKPQRIRDRSKMQDAISFRGGLKHHTVISGARHLPWVYRRRAGQQSGRWTREGSPHQTSRHGAGATLEVARQRTGGGRVKTIQLWYNYHTIAAACQ